MGLGWSHTFGYHNVLNAAVFASGLDRKSDESGLIVLDFGSGLVGGVQRFEGSTKTQSYIAAVNHVYGYNDITFRYGVEGGVIDQKTSQISTTLIPTVAPIIETTEEDFDLNLGRAYVDAVYEITPELKAEAGLFGTYLTGDSTGVPFEQGKLEPRFGAAWAPFEGHWLRAAFMREMSAVNSSTLAPIGILGLQSNQAPIGLGGYSDTFAARWDAEWNSRLFTTLDYQHQALSGLSIDIPGAFDSIDLSEGRIDRLAATANVWLGGGFGAFATYAYTDSENKDPTSFGFGEALPYVPEHSARLGVTWEPFNKRFELDLAAYNLFDEKFNVAASVPGWGRSFVGSLKVRF